MDKGYWGPPTWCTLHFLTVGYRPENRLSVKRFIYSLPYLLPCEYCREHLKGNLQSVPLTEDSLLNNKALFTWSYFLHDLVNKQLKKKPSPSFPVAERYYFQNVNDDRVWGPYLWRVIHAFSASYRPTPEVKQAFKQCIYALAGLIPSKNYREQYLRNLGQVPLNEQYLKDAHNLFLWSYLFHDLMNKQLEKASPAFEDVKAEYFSEQVCSSCGS